MREGVGAGSGERRDEGGRRGGDAMRAAQGVGGEERQGSRVGGVVFI
jgi:hypothetical protein